MYLLNEEAEGSVCLTCFCFIYQDVDRYKLENPRRFHYLNQSNCYELDGVDDSEEYLATRRAMDVVGISGDEQVLFSMSCQVFSGSFSIWMDASIQNLKSLLT